MPLLDHFRPPLSLRRHWHSFHNAWATYLAADLNRRLPGGYFAEANVQFGIEIDVAAFADGPPAQGDGTPWQAPEPTLTVPLIALTDVVEVQVFRDEGGPNLAAAVELVSPSNEDRAAHRDALVTKCASYLQQGVGLALVDVVTDRRANLHDALLARVSGPAEPWDADLYAAAYRPVAEDGETRLRVWHEALALGRPLPAALPFGLRGGLCLSLDLEGTYARTCREQRVEPAGA